MQECTDPKNPACRCASCSAAQHEEDEAIRAGVPWPPTPAAPVHQLAEYRCAPDPAVIWALEKLMSQAKAGELRWFAAVCELDDGATTVGQAGNITDAARVVGKMHFATHRLVRKYLDYDQENG